MHAIILVAVSFPSVGNVIALFICAELLLVAATLLYVLVLLFFFCCLFFLLFFYFFYFFSLKGHLFANVLCSPSQLMHFFCVFVLHSLQVWSGELHSEHILNVLDFGQLGVV